MKRLFIILIASISTLSCLGQTQRQKDSTMIVNGGVCAWYDFTGATVNNASWSGSTINAAASAINGNTSAMDSVVEFGRQIYQPFNIVVTRDSTLYNLAKPGRRAWIIITPSYQWYCGVTICVGGVSFTGSMAKADDTPSWVFDGLGGSNRARVAAHELGHQLGLSHYNSNGGGSGETGWIPLMTSTGTLYSKNMVTLSRGANEFSSQQDDIAIISSGQLYNTGAIGTSTFLTLGGARLGDAGTTFNTAKYLRKNQVFNGFIGVNDSDYYKIEIPSTQSVTIGVTPSYIGTSGTSATLDAAIDIISSTGSIIASSSNTTTLAATITQTLNAGTYRIKVRADKGNANNLTGYGFMGNYTISYTF
jgi:hypothetical protein